MHTSGEGDACSVLRVERGYGNKTRKISEMGCGFHLRAELAIAIELRSAVHVTCAWSSCLFAMFQGTRGSSCSMKAARLARLSVQPVRPRNQLYRGSWSGSRSCSTRDEPESFTITTPLYYANAGTSKSMARQVYRFVYIARGVTP